jgi:hypothetical protein
MTARRDSKSPALVWAEYLPLALTLPLVARLPHPLALSIGRAAGRLAYRLLGTHRAVCHTNLRIAFGTTSTRIRFGTTRGRPSSTPCRPSWSWPSCPTCPRRIWRG